MAGQTNNIRWLLSDGRFLVAGTLGGLGFVEFEISGDATNPRARFGSSFGSSSVQGMAINNELVYLHNSTLSLYEAQYNDISLKYQANDLNIINDDVLGANIQYMASVEQPDVAVYIPHNGEIITE